jgi:hypothetical protein
MSMRGPNRVLRLNARRYAVRLCNWVIICLHAFWSLGALRGAVRLDMPNLPHLRGRTRRHTPHGHSFEEQICRGLAVALDSLRHLSLNQCQSIQERAAPFPSSLVVFFLFFKKSTACSWSRVDEPRLWCLAFLPTLLRLELSWPSPSNKRLEGCQKSEAQASQVRLC